MYLSKRAAPTCLRLASRLGPCRLLALPCAAGMLLAAVLNLALPAVGLAATGWEITLPPPGTASGANPSGLSITVDTRWEECQGYRPVRVTVIPPGPVAADRTVRVEFRADDNHYRNPSSIAVAQEIELPEASGPVVATLAVPQWHDWHRCSLSAWVDGQYAPALSFPSEVGERLQQRAQMGHRWEGDAMSPIIVLLDDAVLPELELALLRSGGTGFMSIGRGHPTSVLGIGGWRERAIRWSRLPVQIGSLPDAASLPTRWIDYNGIDIVAANFGQLQLLAETAPEQFAAIRRWTAAGGNLWVYDIGLSFERLDALQALLAMPDVEPSTPAPQASSAAATLGWRQPDAALRDRAIDGLPQYRWGSGSMTVPTSPGPSATTDAAADEVGVPPFIMRTVGRGKVVALAASNPDDLNVLWPWVFNSVSPDRWAWYRRHGLSLDRDNSSFWEFLIPGVGLAPVTEFQILITLFVIVIGPVNYWLLRRWQRLNLLILTVPLAAALITAALFGYALVADGLDVRVRARSFTEIDQRRGEAVCWTRLSYYAGLSPSEGLTFSGETVVLPLEQQLEDGPRPAGRAREVVWSNDPQGRAVQRLTRGWLPARTPTQFVTIRARQTPARLVVDEPSDGDAGAVRIVNQLGSEIVALTLTDSRGGHHRAASVADGAAATLEAVDRSAAVSELLQQYHANQPLAPGVGGGPGSQLFGSRYYVPWHSGLAAPSQDTGILERSLRLVAGFSDVAAAADDAPLNSSVETGPTGVGQRWLPPRSYLAVVKRCIEVEYGLEDFREADSWHVIFGRW